MDKLLSLKFKENTFFFTLYTLWIYLPKREQTLTNLKFGKDGIVHYRFVVDVFGRVINHVFYSIFKISLYFKGNILERKHCH